MKTKYSGWLFAVLLIMTLGVDKIRSLSKDGFEYDRFDFDNEKYEYRVRINDRFDLDIGIDANGDLEYVANDVALGKQVVSYFKNGTIKSKIKKDSLSKTSDRAYYFFKNSGNLSSDYNYINGVRVGSAIAYHDSSDHIKHIMLYNENGEMYYRKTFDWQGNLVKEEGSKY